MMNDQAFEELLAKRLAGQATPEESAQIESFLRDHPERRKESDEMLKFQKLFAGTFPLAKDISATTPELPAYRMGQLISAVRKEFPSRQKKSFWERLEVRWLLGGSLAAALAVGVALMAGFFSFSGGPAPVGIAQSPPLDDATLARALKEVPVACYALNITTRGGTPPAMPTVNCFSLGILAEKNESAPTVNGDPIASEAELKKWLARHAQAPVKIVVDENHKCLRIFTASGEKTEPLDPNPELWQSQIKKIASETLLKERNKK